MVMAWAHPPHLRSIDQILSRHFPPEEANVARNLALFENGAISLLLFVSIVSKMKRRQPMGRYARQVISRIIAAFIFLSISAVFLALTRIHPINNLHENVISSELGVSAVSFIIGVFFAGGAFRYYTAGKK
jgi:hypothetical protein